MTTCGDKANGDAAVSEAALLGALADVTYEPVFVLGEHRSGTTILYKLLALSGSFNILTAYHALCYDELLSRHATRTEAAGRAEVNRRFEAAGIHHRIIDQMEVDADYPEEYCFVLITRGRSFRVKKRNWPLFDALCRKVQYVTDPRRPLLLKNPFDFDNFMTLWRLLPQARFIFIHRGPMPVLSSQLKAVRTNWQEGNPMNALYSPIYARLQRSRLVRAAMCWFVGPASRWQPGLRVMIRRMRQRQDYYLRNVARLPASAFISVRYEDLCTNPHGTMERIRAFLGITPAVEVDYERWIQPRRQALLPEVEKLAPRLRQDFQAIRRATGCEAAE